jgi:putative ABC transport system permease protein
MMSRIALWLALQIVRAVAILVPAANRADWRREWEAELLYHLAQLRRRPNRTWRTDMNLVSRALGSLPDAAWLRRQFTFDADAAHDAVHAARLLWKTPAFTAIALLVFAIGIGATTAIVSVADALLLRPMPVPDPERVMTVWQYNRETGTDQQDVAPANGIDWLQRTRSFESVSMVEPWVLNSTIANHDPEYLEAARVGEQFFTVLGISMLHGRTFLPQEHQKGGDRVAILGYSMWKDRFGGDPSIVGHAVRLDTENAYTVVGVMPPGIELRLFNDGSRVPEPLVWLPKQGYEAFEPTMRGAAFWNVVGRLRPGVSIGEAQAEFDAISAQLAREYPQTNRNIAAQVVPLRTHLIGSLTRVLPILFGAALILLMVACANVATLLLARGAARGREFAVRHALGANRTRLVRQMLVESLLLAAAGGLVGLFLARRILDVIGQLRPADVAMLDHIPIDARAAFIAIGVTVAAAVIAGLAPAIQLSRQAALNPLVSDRSRGRSRLGGALVSVEVAAALVLAVGAGLLVRSFILIQRVDPGFTRDRVSVVQVFASPRIDTPQKRIVFFEQALERMRSLSGVIAAGGVSSMPFGDAKVIARAPLAIDGGPPREGEQSMAYTTTVAGDYFRVMGVPLVSGRLFEGTDTAASRQVVVVSQSAVRQFWPRSEPIGSRVRFRFSGVPYDAEVVGVVGDVRHEELDKPAPAEVFIPYSQSGFRALTLVVRAAPGPPVTLQALKEQIWAIDPMQSIFRVAMLDRLISKTLVGRRFSLFLIGGFALATLLLALAGVYGVMSFTTSQRTREFGVRIALGAARRDIVRLVFREGLRLAGFGVVAGGAIALLVTRGLRTLLFGVTTTDPTTFLVVIIALVLVSAAACYVPARRAVNVDPAESLRFE